MRIFIKVTDGLRNEIVRKFKFSKVSVWSALNYLTNSAKAESVRRYALEHGGSIVEQDFIPNCRTEHTEEEMIQTFAGGIQVRMSKKNSDVRLLQDGAVQETYKGVNLQGWGNLLSHAQELSESRVAAAARK